MIKIHCTEFKFGTLKCQVNDDGWLTIKQDAEQGNPEQDIGVGKVDGERFKALANAVRFMEGGKYSKTKEYQEVMVCAVAGCWEVDESHSAFCRVHGRSSHHMIKVLNSEGFER